MALHGPAVVPVFMCRLAFEYIHTGGGVQRITHNLIKLLNVPLAVKGLSKAKYAHSSAAERNVEMGM